MKTLKIYLFIFFIIAIFCVDAVAEELSFVIIIPSYNNAAYVERTLNSAMMQKYSNFRIIYIDDCSTDNSPFIVESYIRRCNLYNKITFIRNSKRQRKLKNIYTVIHEHCHDHEIAVMLDCDDWFANDQVFNLINRLYQTNDTWFTYGQDCPHPQDVARKWGIPLHGNCSATPQAIIQGNNFRNYQWVYMHLRTFPVWLFKLIKLEDLLAENVKNFQGNFYPACNDYAMYYPMLEMAGRHITFNPQLVYYYNCGSPLNGFKIDRQLQISSATEIKTSKRRYQPLQRPILNRLDQFNNQSADVILFSEDFYQTEHAVQAIRQHYAGIRNIYVITNGSPESYNDLVINYPGIKILDADTCINEIPQESNYYVLLHDTDTLPTPINIVESIKRLEQTFGHCYFYIKPSASLITQEINEGLSVCKFSINQGITYNTTHGALYRAADLLPIDKNLTITQWFTFWQQAAIDLQKIGLIQN